MTFTKNLREGRIRERLLALSSEVFVRQPLLQLVKMKYKKLKVYQCLYLYDYES
jgi:hypothetical protein